MSNLLLIILFGFCIYLWIQNDQLKGHNSKRKKIRSKQGSNYSAPSPVDRAKSINNRSEPNLPIEPQRREQRSSRHPTFNTGIPELDGPGIWHRLNQYPSGHALYLLYSRSHEAYKVGVSEPARLAHRIRMVREEVPDAVLNGLAVFTSRQNAFDREQEVLTRYRNNQYLGIRGRYSGGSEWISVRPIGRPYFTTPERIEEMFRESIEAPTQELVIPDIYTVYLLYSRSKNMYKCSW